MKKKIHKLSHTESQPQVAIIGIASHENDYRLSWALNNALGLHLQKSNYLTLEVREDSTIQAFSVYIQNETDHDLQVVQVSNKCESGFFLNSHKNIDFLLLIAGDLTSEEIRHFTKKISAIEMVMVAFSIEKLTAKEQKRILLPFQ